MKAEVMTTLKRTRCCWPVASDPIIFICRANKSVPGTEPLLPDCWPVASDPTIFVCRANKSVPGTEPLLPDCWPVLRPQNADIFTSGT